METLDVQASRSLLPKLLLKTVDSCDAHGGQHVAYKVRIAGDMSADEADVLFETLIRKVCDQLEVSPDDRLFVAVELQEERETYWAILCPLETVSDNDPEECAAKFRRKPIVAKGKCHFGRNSLVRVILEHPSLDVADNN